MTQRPDPDSAALASWRNDAATLARNGRDQLRQGRTASAHYSLHRALALAPAHGEAHCDLGQIAFAAGDVARARAHFTAALALDTTQAAAAIGLARCLLHANEKPAAIAALAPVLALPPPSPSRLLDFASITAQAGDPALAQHYFDQLEQIAPAESAGWLARGVFLREQGDAAAALPWIDRYGRQHPHDAAARLEKARCLLALGQNDAAMRWLEKLEVRQPGIAENSAIYGECLHGSSQADLRAVHWVRAVELWIAAGNSTAAYALAQRLLREQPGRASGWNALGRLELAQAHWAAAEIAWRRALELDPALLDAAAGLAHLYEETNRPDPAAAVARAALTHWRAGEKRSGAIELHLALAKAARRAKDSVAGLAHVAQAQVLAVSESQHEHVAFERARLLESRHDDHNAFAEFQRGNTLALAGWQRAHPGPNPYLAGIEAMLARVHGGWLQTLPRIEAPAAISTPAFLIGFPRSGTSLLNQVFDGHSRIHALEEKPPMQAVLQAVRAMPGGYPDAMANFDAIDVEYLREIYFRSAREHGVDDRGRLLLDKFPLHINLAALIHRVFPEARFIFALRHPCDVVLSCFMQQFRLNHAMANFCTLENTVALYARTMDLWELVRSQLPLAVHTIRYEDVVADFDSQVRSLCEFLRLPWEDDLRRFAERAHDRGRIDTPSYAQVSRPLYGDAVYRWQRYREPLAPFLPALQPYIERFGYA